MLNVYIHEIARKTNIAIEDDFLQGYDLGPNQHPRRGCWHSLRLLYMRCLTAHGWEERALSHILYIYCGFNYKNNSIIEFLFLVFSIDHVWPNDCI